ncbi:MAG: hypothetical protein L0212_13035 [Acidobacteria bacterium]|nr:hypothetical protein [Acidobacteriota bacterium]
MALAGLGAVAPTQEGKSGEAVRLEVPDAKVNHDLGLREIQKASGAKPPGGATYMNGFTRLVLEVATRLETGMRTTVRGEKSVWVEGVEVRLSYSAVEIFIPREYAEGSCPYDVVLEHEREHVARDRTLLEDFVARVEKGLKRAELPTAARPLGGLTEEEGKRRIEEALEKTLKPSLDELKRKREEARAALDTRKNYEALRRRCNERGD